MNHLENGRKLAFVGTSSAGKTTLIEDYKHRFEGDPRVAFVEEAARIYFTKNSHIPVLERFSFKHQSEIQDLAMQSELAAHRSMAETIMCDRSVLDAAAYVRGHDDIKGSEQLLERVHHWLPTYHIIYLLDPNDVPYVLDEIRQENPIVRQRNHEAFLTLMDLNRIPFTLLSGNHQQRVKQVDEVVLFQR